MKVAHKLILSFLIISLFILVIGYFAVCASREALENAIGKSSVSLAESLINKIDRNLYFRIQEFQILCKNSILQEQILKSNQEFSLIGDPAVYIKATDQEWVSGIKAETSLLIQDLLNNDASLVLQRRVNIDQKIYEFSVIAEIFITNGYGVVAALSGKTTDYYQADEQWWVSAKEDGLYVSSIYYDESLGAYSVSVGIRIDDQNGKFIGVMKVVLDIKEIFVILEEFEKTKKYQTAEFKLLDENGKIIYSSESFQLLSGIPSELMDQLLSRNTSSGYFMLGGVFSESGRLNSYAYSGGYRDFKGLGWVVLLNYHTDEIFAPVVHLRNNLQMIFLAAAVLAILLGIVVSKIIIVPVVRLSRIAVEFGKGRLNTPVGIDSDDEIGQLANSLGKMAKDLSMATVSRDYVDNILKTLVESVIVTNPDGVILTVNPSGNKLLDCSGQYLIGKSISTIFAEGEYFKETKWGELVTKNEGYIKSRETILCSKSGKYVPVNFSVSCKLGENGEIEYMVCSAVNISDRKKASDELNKVNLSLSKNEKALTNMLYDLKAAHDDLKYAQKKLVQAEKMASIGQLAAGVAHEINNPLGFVTSNISTLKRYILRICDLLEQLNALQTAVRKKDFKKAVNIQEQVKKLEDELGIKYILGDINKLIDESQEGVNRIKKIVLDLKTFSHQDDNIRSDTDLNTVIDGIVNIVWNEIKYKIKLNKQYEQIPLIKANTQQMGQVFINLLVNASQAIDKQGNISVKTYLKDKQIYVEIIDDGPGIPKEIIDKIFDPFFTTKEVGQGTGLGLSISYDIIKAHGGEIIVESQFGQGAKFTVILPC